MKPPEVNSGPSVFPERRYFLAGLVHPQAALLPSRRGRKGLVPPTLVHTERHQSRDKERCHPRVGLWGYEKASLIPTCKMGVVRTE